MTELPREIFDVAGYLGVVLYLGSFGALQLGMIRGTGYPYILMNLAASSLVLTSLVVAFNMSSALIQIFWITFSVLGLGRRMVLNRRTRFSEREELLRRQALSRLPKPVARTFLDLGTWLDLPAGTVLTKQGAPVDTVYFLLSGIAAVSFDGQRVGSVDQGFIGEMNVLERGPASANVDVETTGEAFAIEGDSLRRACARDSEFQGFVEDVFAKDTRRKLTDANMRLASHAVSSA